MISEKTNNLMKSLAKSESDYKVKLQDFTDEQAKALLRKCGNDPERLVNQLKGKVQDKEVLAHLYGFNSHKERMTWIENIQGRLERGEY